MSRRYDNWIELADRLNVSRSCVVAVCFFLNKQWSTGRVSKALRLSIALVERIEAAARPMLRKPRAIAVKEFMKNSDGEVCSYCGSSRGPLTVDHQQPRSRGGTNDIENLVLACRSCNSAKGDRTPEEWLG